MTSVYLNSLDPTILLNIYRQNTKWWGSELDGLYVDSILSYLVFWNQGRGHGLQIPQSYKQTLGVNQWTAVSNCRNLSQYFQKSLMLINSILLKILIHIYKCLLGLGNVLSSSHASSHLHNWMRWNLYYFCLQKERLKVVWYNVLHVTGGKTWRRSHWL